jgi:fatty-acyl-CoA synthase
MTTGVELVQAAPQDFMAHPGNWMQWISDWRGTATAGPNFSWVLATRALKARQEG